MGRHNRTDTVSESEESARRPPGALRVSDRHVCIKIGRRDIIPGRNLVHLMMASNEKWIVPAGPDARRFAVFNVSDNRKGERAFFAQLHKQLDDGGLAGMVHDLTALDLGDWHPSRDMPRTEALAEQKLLGLTPVMKWWHETLSRGELPLIGVSSDQWSSEPITVGSEGRRALLDDFDLYLKRNRIYHEKATFPALTDLGRALGLETRRVKRGSERAWVLPPLPEMRAALGRHVGSEALFD